MTLEVVIHVEIHGDGPIQGAYVIIWQGNNKIEGGVTDADGLYRTWLEPDLAYCIDVKWGEQDITYDNCPVYPDIYTYVFG
jgi:hypothetical protein